MPGKGCPPSGRCSSDPARSTADPCQQGVSPQARQGSASPSATPPAPCRPHRHRQQPTPRRNEPRPSVALALDPPPTPVAFPAAEAPPIHSRPALDLCRSRLNHPSHRSKGTRHPTASRFGRFHPHFLIGQRAQPCPMGSEYPCSQRCVSSWMLIQLCRSGTSMPVGVAEGSATVADAASRPARECVSARPPQPNLPGAMCAMPGCAEVEPWATKLAKGIVGSS